jgi:hypothetical protein
VTGSEILLYFIGIPLALAAIVTLFVAAPSWTRSSRGRATDEFDAAEGADSLFITSESAAPNPSILPREISADASRLTAGGAHASW